MVKLATLAVLLLAGLAAARVPRVPDVTEVTEIPDVPEATEVPDLPEITEAPEDPEVTEVPDVPELTEAPEDPEVTEAPEDPEVTESPEEPEATEAPEEPEVTETPEDPEVTEAPEEPDVTEAPEEPEVTEAPEEPEPPVGPGTPVSIEKFPSVVQIEKKLGSLWVQGCVGTILTSRHVLSVAHCFQYDIFAPRVTRIRAGSSERGRDGQIYDVDFVNYHPYYRPESPDNDIAILYLRHPLSFGSKIQQATIVAPDIVFPANIPVDVATWGRTSWDSPWDEGNLYSIKVFTIEHSTCVRQYASLDNPIFINDNMMCTTVPNASADPAGFGDAGAPFFYDNILVGMTGKNFGAGLPQLATAISPFTSWIIENAV